MVCYPGNRLILAFARGKWMPLTLANNIFGALPGVISWYSTLANVVFYRLPGATTPIPTLTIYKKRHLPGA